MNTISEPLALLPWRLRVQFRGVQFRGVQFLGALFLALTILAAPAVAAQGASETLKVAGEEGEHVFQVEVAVTPTERARGLMYRRSLAPDAGMLFDFGSEREINMWMKNTYLSLDMIFIGADRKVRSIARQTTPLSETTVSSGRPARFVLEIPGGTAARLGIKPGAEVFGPAIEKR
ncbi:DUF192 domain-containing protein [Afifella pfennigii]|uniref:DUF192 domain-containing protein n=1 Tax=Afifella pfennigii TaxID=209897 RepID=UPI0009FC4491|nr:DUF192 domain-containing protein [Afifella pfennigii]